MLLLLATGVNVIAWAVHIITTRTLRLVLTPFSVALLLVGVISLLSTFIASNNPVEALVGRGTLIPTLCVLVFSVMNTINNKKFIRYALYAFITSATVLSLVGIFQSLGYGPSHLFNQLMNTNFPHTLAFTPAGSSLGLFTYLVIAMITTLFMAFTSKESLEKVALFLVTAVMTAGLVLVAIYAFPGKPTAPVFLPVEFGYSIAMETIKDTQTALLGHGPESFIVAYNKNRPALVNLSEFWNTRFTNSSNEFFTIMTTTGLLGIASWIILAVVVLRTAKRTFGQVEVECHIICQMCVENYWRTSRSGHFPSCNTRSATLPQAVRAIPERPCVDIAIKLNGLLSEYSPIFSAGLPIITSNSVVIPFSFSFDLMVSRYWRAPFLNSSRIASTCSGQVSCMLASG